MPGRASADDVSRASAEDVAQASAEDVAQASADDVARAGGVRWEARATWRSRMSGGRSALRHGAQNSVRR